MSRLASLFTLRERRQVIGLVLGPLLFLLAGTALTATGLKPSSAWAAATVLLMSCWWITEPIPLWATACLPIVTFPWLSGASLWIVLLQYFDPVNFLFLGGMWIAACMEQWGLHRRLALGIVAKIGTSPTRIVLGFMLATGFITLWISNTAAAMMMYPIGLAVLRKFEERQDRSDPALAQFGLALMLGIAYAASIGGIGSKIGTGTNLVFVKNSPQPIDFLTWAKIGMPVVLIALPLVWYYLTRFGAKISDRPLAGGTEAIHEELAGMGKMSRGEVIALLAFLTAVFLWVFRRDIELDLFVLPGWSRLVPWSLDEVVPLRTWAPALQRLLADPGDAMVAMGVALLLFFVPVRITPWEAALSARRAARVSWGMLVLLGGGFAMAYGIQASGLSTTIAGALENIGRLHPYVAGLVVSFIAIALTEVASNTATASILLPILAATAPSFGLHPLPLMLTATMAASFGFMLPAGTPPNAIVYASGYITVPRMVKCGFAVDLFGAILVATLCYFLAPWALGL